MELDELLQEIRRRHLILTARATLWAPNTHVPLATRRAIRMHRRQLAQLIAAADIRTCASPTWHRSYWKHTGGQSYTCEVCAAIAV